MDVSQAQEAKQGASFAASALSADPPILAERASNKLLRAITQFVCSLGS
jgi:hypothetical protein